MVIKNQPASTGIYVYCKDCKKKFECFHDSGTYKHPGHYNGTPPSYCKVCHKQMTDFLGRKIDL